MGKLGVGLLMTVGGVVALVVFILPAIGVMKTYRAPSESMLPEIAPGERFFILKAGYTPEVGDVAVFRGPGGAETGECGVSVPTGQMCAEPAPGRARVSFVKRVVAGPGDRIRMQDGRLIRNGRPEAGYALRPCEGASVCDFPQEITVPPGHFFVLGDNRGASQDSRFWGPVPEAHFEGRRILTYWR